MRPILDAMQMFVTDPVSVPLLPRRWRDAPERSFVTARASGTADRPRDAPRDPFSPRARRENRTGRPRGTSRAMYPGELRAAGVLVDASQVPSCTRRSSPTPTVWVGVGSRSTSFRAHLRGHLREQRVKYPGRFAALDSTRPGRQQPDAKRWGGCRQPRAVPTTGATAGVRSRRILSDAEDSSTPGSRSFRPIRRASQLFPPDALPDPAGYVGGYVIAYIAIPSAHPADDRLLQGRQARAERPRDGQRRRSRGPVPDRSAYRDGVDRLRRSRAHTGAGKRCAAALLNQNWGPRRRRGGSGLANELPGLTQPLPGDAPPVAGPHRDRPGACSCGPGPRSGSRSRRRSCRPTGSPQARRSRAHLLRPSELPADAADAAPGGPDAGRIPSARRFTPSPGRSRRG